MKLERERGYLLPPWDGPLHTAEELLEQKPTRSLLCPQHSPSQERKEWRKVWRADWVTVGSHTKKPLSPAVLWGAGGQQNAISYGPLATTGSTVFTAERSLTSVICTSQKTAAWTLINNRPAQPSPVGADRALLATALRRGEGMTPGSSQQG